MAQFSQYAMAATEEALEDAAWKPTSHEQREATVGFSDYTTVYYGSFFFFFFLIGD
jgi:3-oxoacyl-(acyl-carrier-protein) synthase